MLWVGTRLGTGRLGVSLHRVRDRLVGAQVESGALELAWATLAAAASAGPGRHRGGTWAVARLDRLVDRETPVARRIARMQGSRCAEVRPLRQAAVGRQERAAGVRPATT
jgi:hypothetical protein